MIRKVSLSNGAGFKASTETMFNSYMWVDGLRSALSSVRDVIEDLKLELELEGRDEIGNIYKAGSEFDYFKDLKVIFSQAKRKIFLIDPYFGEDAFRDYFSDFKGEYELSILSQGSQAKQLQPYADKHKKQFSSSINLRTSKRRMTEFFSLMVLTDG